MTRRVYYSVLVRGIEVMHSRMGGSEDFEVTLFGGIDHKAIAERLRVRAPQCMVALDKAGLPVPPEFRIEMRDYADASVYGYADVVFNVTPGNI